jgi:hypothetical protein
MWPYPAKLKGNYYYLFLNGLKNGLEFINTINNYFGIQFYGPGNSKITNLKPSGAPRDETYDECFEYLKEQFFKTKSPKKAFDLTYHYYLGKLSYRNCKGIRDSFRSAMNRRGWDKLNLS